MWTTKGFVGRGRPGRRGPPRRGDELLRTKVGLGTTNPRRRWGPVGGTGVRRVWWWNRTRGRSWSDQGYGMGWGITEEVRLERSRGSSVCDLVRPRSPVVRSVCRSPGSPSGSSSGTETPLRTDPQFPDSGTPKTYLGTRTYRDDFPVSTGEDGVPYTTPRTEVKSSTAPT